MTTTGPGASQEDIYKKLYDQAVERWGVERAEAIRPNLERVAASLWHIGNNLPDREEEPAFFL